LGVLMERAAHAACLRSLQLGEEEEEKEGETEQGGGDMLLSGAPGSGNRLAQQLRVSPAKEECLVGKAAAAAASTAVPSAASAPLPAGASAQGSDTLHTMQQQQQQQQHIMGKIERRGMEFRGSSNALVDAAMRIEDVDVDAAVRDHTPATFWQLQRSDGAHAGRGGADGLGLKVCGRTFWFL